MNDILQLDSYLLHLNSVLRDLFDFDVTDPSKTKIMVPTLFAALDNQAFFERIPKVSITLRPQMGLVFELQGNYV